MRSNLQKALRIVTALLLMSAVVRGQSGDALTGAGSTFAAPLYEKWIASFMKKSPGMPIRFEAIGSGEGLELLEHKKVEFAASDFVPADEVRTRLKLHIVPTAIGGVVPAYNLPGVQSELRFTPQLLAAIYLGLITKWDDPQIKAINRQAKLPSAPIIPVHRSDASGTTYIWTQFLSANENWRRQMGVTNAVSWPNGKGAARNEGMAQLLSQTPFSLGYVEYIYAVKHHLEFGAVQNAAGNFIRADVDSVQAAADSAPADSLISIVNSPGERAYPIASATWFLIPFETPEPKRKRLSEFLEWALSEGQREAAALGYIAAPDRFCQKAKATVAELSERDN